MSEKRVGAEAERRRKQAVDNAFVRGEYKGRDTAHEQAVASLYLLAGEYGGDRFVYAAADQEELEAIAAKIEEYSDLLTEQVGKLNARLDSIQTLR